MVGGALLFAALLGGAVFMAVFIPNLGTLPRTMIVVPIGLLAFGLIHKGWAQARSVKSVALTPAGIEVVDRRGQTQLQPWDELAFAVVEDGGPFSAMSLQVFGFDGKRRLKLPGGLKRFGELCDAVKAKLSGAPATAIDRAKLIRNRRVAVYTFIGAVVFGLLSAFVIFTELQEQRDAERLAVEAVEGEGKVIELKMAPNGVTPRLIYSFQGDERNVEIPQVLYDLLNVGDNINVDYVPGEPTLHRFPGEVARDGERLGPLMWVMPVVVLAFLVMSVLAWIGVTLEDTGSGHRLRRLRPNAANQTPGSASERA